MSKEDYISISRKYDKRFNLIYVNFIALALALGLAWLVYMGFRDVGMFSLFKRTGDLLWYQETFNYWWGNPNSMRGNRFLNHLIFISWFSTATFIFYYILMHNYVGITVVSLLLDVAKKKVNGPVFRLDLNDEYGGLGIINRILNQVGYSVIMMLIAIFFVVSYGRIAPVNYTFYVFCLLVFIGLNPLYLFLPVIRLNKILRKVKNAELVRINREMGKTTETLDLMRLQLEYVRNQAFKSQIVKVSSMTKLTLQIIFWIFMIVYRLLH